ncbi:hypothetical protein VM1G_11426 [Cytospora mali]|uniref:Uncharacterized protein n=1 Tax=Cytospora mali TaxID=578113 RepID=A0A194VR94_CYTMA|nr:hypothetical protein VM1G_11426 [Valsa mali]
MAASTLKFIYGVIPAGREVGQLLDILKEGACGNEFAQDCLNFTPRLRLPLSSTQPTAQVDMELNRMGYRDNLPASLIREMNKDESIAEFDEWRATTDPEIFRVPAHYDKQRTIYATSIENE